MTAINQTNRKDDLCNTKNVLAQIIGDTLGEPTEKSLQVAEEWLSFRERTRRIWMDGEGLTFEKTKIRAMNIRLLDTHAIKNYLESRRSGLAFLSIHMGDYLHSILRLISYTSPRDVLILRKKDVSHNEMMMYNKLAKFGHTVSIVDQSYARVRKAIRLLRTGAVLVALHDLSSNWGRVAVVRAFGRKLQWSCGPISIAVAGKCSVLPFYCFQEGGLEYCHIMPVRDYQYRNNGNEKKFVAEEVEKFASQAEYYIKMYPSQWSHWPLIPSMLQE